MQKNIIGKFKNLWNQSKKLNINQQPLKNEWMFFQYPTECRNYVAEMNVTIHSIFKELQWGFRMSSIYECLRFRLIDN